MIASAHHLIWTRARYRAALPIAVAAAAAAVPVAVPPSPPALVAASACRVLGAGVAEQGLDPWTFGL